jgi:peptidoglycan/xylan/chitin deacetylase (PgdA/CDA1 family)
VWCSLFVTRLSLFTPLNYSALITMRLSHVFTLPMVAMLVAARIPRYAAPSKRNMLESRQSGPTTRNDPRPQKGNIPYGGAGIVTCKQPGTVAITFDDGPNIYTGQVLNLLAQYGFKATFFVCGDNGHGALDADSRWIDVVRRMDAEGHQVGSHTWSHPHMNDITDDQRYDEMVKTEMAIRNILGKYPTYMRPPYTECNDACQTVMKNLGYVIANYDLDTQDWAHQDNIQEAKDIFYRGNRIVPDSVHARVPQNQRLERRHLGRMPRRAQGELVPSERRLAASKRLSHWRLPRLQTRPVRRPVRRDVHGICLWDLLFALRILWQYGCLLWRRL